MKKLIFAIVSFVMVVIVAALVTEAALRVRELFDKNRGLKNCMGDINRKYWHSFKPNSRFRLVASKNNEFDVAVRINNYGFRGRDISIDKAPGVTRIMAIGDSFTFGVGAEEDETIPSLIEKDLRANGANVEVVNAGFGSYSPVLHYLKLRDEYLEFRPDIVILFFDFSDLADDWRAERSLVYDGSGKILRCDPSFVDGKRDWWLEMCSHCRLCSFINNKLVRLIDKIRILGFKEYVKAKLAGKRAKALIVEKDLEDKSSNPIKYDGYLMIRGRNKLSYIKEHFNRNERYLDLIRDALAEQGIPMVLVIYPYGIHVGPDQWGTGREYWGFEKGRVYDDYYAFELLEDYARSRNIPCVNLLPDFLKHKDENLFFDIDGHFTPEANRLAAQSIVNNGIFRKILSRITTKTAE